MSKSKLDSLRIKAEIAEQDVVKAKSREDALEAAITAAESYMQAMRLTEDTVQKREFDTSCRKYLDKAERIKNDQDWKRIISSPARRSNKSLERPRSQRPLTTKENIILLEGSKVNGFIFPPWKYDPTREDFECQDGAKAFEDVTRLNLSADQQELFAGWKRPVEAFSYVSSALRSKDNITPTMSRSKVCDLVQDATSDCSIVASLCAGTARAQRGHSKLLSRIIFPYDSHEEHPAISPSGKYILRLTFNGCDRKVTIDDFLPVSKNSRTLFVIDRNNPGLIWPALVEKAYLKVRGGYDFPGSNSGTDIATLTGWIPEQIFLHDHDVMPEQLWKRVSNAFSYGDVLVTIGTGAISEEEQSQFGLAGEHDYAVLDMREIDGSKKLLIKNPWSDGGVWKGRQGDQEPAGWEATTPDRTEETDQFSMTPGTFWMDLGSVFQYFENLYLNWNPGLFTHREDSHFSWNLSQDVASPGYFGDNPQFSIQASEGGPVWLLLSKHFKSGEHGSKADAPRGYISLYLFAKGGQRVFLSDGAVQRGPFVDSPNTLLRADLPKNTPYTVTIASQSLQPTKHNFTLSAFSRSKMSLTTAQNKYQFTTTKTSSWTQATFGGNSDSPTYLNNPQFSLSIPNGPASIALVLSCSNSDQSDLAIHSKIFFLSTDPQTPTTSRRITSVRTRDILADTGDYRRRTAVLETTLQPGLYTIICSTFEATSTTSSSPVIFTLTLSSTHPSITLQGPLPPESAGRFCTLSSPATFPDGTNRMLAPLTTSRLVRAKFIARYKSSHPQSTRPPLKLALEHGQGPYKDVLATSSSSTSTADNSDFSDPGVGVGVRIEDLDLRPEWCRRGLWVVVERMLGGGEGGGGGTRGREDVGAVEVEVLAEGNRVVLGEWGIGEG